MLLPFRSKLCAITGWHKSIFMSCKGSLVGKPIVTHTQVIWEWAISHSGVGRKSQMNCGVLMPLLCDLTNVSAWGNFKNDLWPIYDHAKWYTSPPGIMTILQATYYRKTMQLQGGHSQLRSTRFLWLKRSCNLLISIGSTSAYCEYSGVPYDFLVSNIGGTYDLAQSQTISSPSRVQGKTNINLLCIYHEQI